jgi:hypothetical protein
MTMRFTGFTALLSLPPLQLPPALAENLIYSTMQVTTMHMNHEWPAINSNGTIIWSQPVVGPCQYYGISQPRWTPYTLAPGRSESNAIAVVVLVNGQPTASKVNAKRKKSTG